MSQKPISIFRVSLCDRMDRKLTVTQDFFVFCLNLFHNSKLGCYYHRKQITFFSKSTLAIFIKFNGNIPCKDFSKSYCSLSPQK